MNEFTHIGLDVHKDTIAALLVGGRLRQDRDVRFQSADISMVDCRSHVPARLHRPQGGDPLEDREG
jgi:hypothetical protein